ncbi:hypothetical protein [Mycobacterium mantenii]|uniref:hypothetical protein n=1 Tax=Mycobacterium mantenii TaxID=560555 RepID=UPI001E33F46C|nr:hypothetical protein [Mycobacterium mantenii]
MAGRGQGEQVVIDVALPGFGGANTWLGPWRFRAYPVEQIAVDNSQRTYRERDVVVIANGEHDAALRQMQP